MSSYHQRRTMEAGEPLYRASHARRRSVSPVDRYPERYATPEPDHALPPSAIAPPPRGIFAWMVTIFAHRLPRNVGAQPCKPTGDNEARAVRAARGVRCGGPDLGMALALSEALNAGRAGTRTESGTCRYLTGAIQLHLWGMFRWTGKSVVRADMRELAGDMNE